jgi:rhodanese-related sulfurtransferase
MTPETETRTRASGADLIAQAKAEIEEIQPTEAAAEIAEAKESGDDVALVDVREQAEFDERHIEGAIHVPRSYLESRFEQFVPDRSRRVILYCASGIRSALAAKTLAEDLGYEDVSSMAGGITLWRDRGLPVVTPRALTPEQKERYSRHILVPEIGLEGQMKMLDSKVLLLGAGGLGSRTGLYMAAACFGMIGN